MHIKGYYLKKVSRTTAVGTNSGTQSLIPMGKILK